MFHVRGVARTHHGSFAVPDLPTTNVDAGDTAYATDALKASESTGNGTGNAVFYDGTNWIRADTGATAGA